MANHYSGCTTVVNVIFSYRISLVARCRTRIPTCILATGKITLNVRSFSVMIFRLASLIALFEIFCEHASAGGMYVYVCMVMYARLCMCVRMYTFMYVCSYVYACICVREYVRVY